ncbi:F0F1 ATP synthase subunit delta [Bacillus salipaludis]|uniref:ATP synthase subunit delta n=1 Tax=Bacillus salipaludis TaxID=2547811 RepID=A0A4R5VX66_9BACI|nr:F0F1 ATP synthase subunit delta [Bacillus salipaludis]MDQ6595168.1 F0F1 ATP synthase subunit delta [Bacillus salipaludis]TDK63975.1 F0F1 ATP synthase subunit delta [Bacillus salipaludis]
MSNSIVAKRYASALFQIAKEQQVLSQVEEDLRVVKEVIQTNKDLKAVLSSLKLSKENKKAILKQAFANINGFVVNTLMILMDRHREGEIVEVVDQFIELAYEASGVAEAEVSSVRPLSDAEREAISATFAAKVGKQSLRIENIVDSELLGGVKVRIGNRIYDGSLRGKLDRLQRKLLS